MEMYINSTIPIFRRVKNIVERVLAYDGIIDTQCDYNENE